jgi:hypothetical protein
VSAAPTWMAERAILLQLLRDDHDERWTPTELVNETTGLGPRAIRAGLARLSAEGVTVELDGHVLASRCARRLDDLELRIRR